MLGGSRLRAWLLGLALTANVAAAALTFFVPDLLLGPAVMNGSARGTALVMLVAAVPLVLLSLWLERIGSRWASAVRIGALAYLAYNGFMLLFGTPFNRLFLVYVASMSLTVFALAVEIGRAPHARVAEALGRGSARVIGGYIFVIVTFNALAWLRTIVPAVTGEDPTAHLVGTGLATNPVFVQDLTFWLPAAALIGWLAWTRRPWGALLAGAYLLFGLLESVGVAVDQWFGSTADPASEIATMGAVYLFAVLAVIGLVALGFYRVALLSADRPTVSVASTSHA